MSTTDWHISQHARVRAAELGFTLLEVLDAADAPHVSYRQPDRGPHQAMHQRGDVAVGVNLGTRTVCTVLLRRRDTWSHGIDRRSTA